ncbi:MAG: AMP-binding protein, partial [Acidimicrobiales bacterium]
MPLAYDWALIRMLHKGNLMAETTAKMIEETVAGTTVSTVFRDAVRNYADQVALRWRNADDSWSELTWSEYADQACRFAGGLTALGVGKGDRVALMIRNQHEFHIADTGALLVGATPISIYNSSSPEQVEYLVGHSKAKVAIAEDVGFLERFLKVRPELPALEHLIVIHDPDGLAPSDVTTYASLLEADPVDLDTAAAISQPGDLATVIYTSGTTGPPKGVMITHSNVVWTAESLRTGFGLSREELAGKRIVSYLPMAHIA